MQHLDIFLTVLVVLIASTRSTELKLNASCVPRDTPKLEVTFLSVHQQVQIENISDLISLFYNDSCAHYAYFFPEMLIPNVQVQIKCTAEYPIEIDIESAMAVRVAGLTYTRTRRPADFMQPCSYQYEVTFNLTLNYTVTGNYICQEIGTSIPRNSRGRSTKASSVLLFVNDGNAPILLNSNLNIKPLEVDGIPDDEGLIRIPCISTNPRQEPTLFKVLQVPQQANMSHDYVKYHPGQGFLISAMNNVPVSYTCTLGNFSLQFRLRDLTTQNIGMATPVHVRVTPTRRENTIYDLDKRVTMSLVCESNRPVVFSQGTLIDSKLRFATNQSENEGSFYKYKAMLTMTGQIRKSFTVTCEAQATGGVLHTWRYKVLPSPTSGSLTSPEIGISHTDETGRHHFQCIASENKTPFIALIECFDHLNCKTAQTFSYLVNIRPEFYPFNVSIGYACYKPQSSMGCAIIPLEVGKRDGLVMCREELSKGGVTYYYQNYYTGLGGHIVTQLDKYPASDALQFLPSDTKLYLGQNATFVCHARTFLFAKGIEFYIHFKNNTKLPAREYEPDFSKITINETLEDGLIRSEIILPIKSLDIQKLGCSAPSWNTPTWQSIFVNLDIIEGEFVQVLSNRHQKNQVTFTVGQVNQSLICEARGEPRPTIEWKKDEQAIMDLLVENIEPSITILDHQNGSNQIAQSELRFIKVKESHDGVYSCIASNKKGKAFKQFVVYVPKQNLWVYIGVILTICIVLVVVIGVISKMVYRRKLLRATAGKLTEIEITEFMQGNQDMRQKYTDLHDNARYLPYKQDFEIPKDKLDIKTDELLGSGMSGLVYKGFLTKHGALIPVAIKTTKSSDLSTLKILLSEIKILMYIGNHVNVINLLGARTSELREGKLLAVVEFCKFGCLQSFIRQHRSSFVDQIENDQINPRICQIRHSRSSEPVVVPQARRSKAGISWKLGDAQLAVPKLQSCPPPPHMVITTIDLVRWSQQIASGMEYLGQKKIIHGDLALRNILLSEDTAIKITDFGLSKHLRDYEIYYKKRKDDLLPWRWLAIEAIGDSRFSIETDIWAYAVTLWEIYSLAETPYQGLSWGEEFVQKLTHGYRLPQAKYSTKSIHDMMLKCWAKKPHQRPKFTVLKTYFEELVAEAEKEHEYVEPVS